MAGRAPACCRCRSARRSPALAPIRSRTRCTAPCRAAAAGAPARRAGALWRPDDRNALLHTLTLTEKLTDMMRNTQISAYHGSTPVHSCENSTCAHPAAHCRTRAGRTAPHAPAHRHERPARARSPSARVRRWAGRLAAGGGHAHQKGVDHGGEHARGAGDDRVASHLGHSRRDGQPGQHADLRNARASTHDRKERKEGWQQERRLTTAPKQDGR